MEWNKYRKFFVPAVAVALIVNANINKDSNQSATFPSKDEAEAACKRDKSRVASRKVISGKYFEITTRCIPALESRHFKLWEYEEEMINFGNKNRSACEKKEERINNKLRKNKNIVGNATCGEFGFLRRLICSEFRTCSR